MQLVPEDWLFDHTCDQNRPTMHIRVSNFLAHKKGFNFFYPLEIWATRTGLVTKYVGRTDHSRPPVAVIVRAGAVMVKKIHKKYWDQRSKMPVEKNYLCNFEPNFQGLPLLGFGAAELLVDSRPLFRTVAVWSSCHVLSLSYNQKTDDIQNRS